MSDGPVLLQRRLHPREAFELMPEDPAADPATDVPPTRAPRLVRDGLRILTLPLILLEDVLDRLLYAVSPEQPKISGGCTQRGRCCRYITIQWPTRRFPWIKALLTWWYTQVHAFYTRRFSVEVGDSGDYQIFSCRNVLPDGRCAEHRLRPMVCRRWPRSVVMRGGAPFKGCGFDVSARPGTRLTVLDD